MMLPEKNPRPSAATRVTEHGHLQHPILPSPVLYCACSLCIMLAGINITLVGAFAVHTLITTRNLLILGPLLLLIALAFFSACCAASRRPPSRAVRKVKGANKWGLVQIGTTVFEMETSEQTLQDSMVVQLGPIHSSSSSHKSTSNGNESPATLVCQEGTCKRCSLSRTSPVQNTLHKLPV